jgi:hypothetical protein
MMNDSEDVLYIANMDGSCYIEFTGEGYINIYGQRSISLRAEKDVNIHADNDINLNAQNTIRMHSNTSIETETDVATDLAITGKTSKGGYIDVTSDSSLRIQTTTFGLTASDSLLLSSDNGGWTAAEGLLFQSAVGGWTTADALTFKSTGGGWHDAGDLTLKADGKIYLNTNTPTDPDLPPAPDTPNDVNLFDFDNGLYKQDDTSYTSATGKWDTVSQSAETVAAIMPAHEPWIRVSGTNNIAEIDNLVNQKPVPAEKPSSAPPNTPLGSGTDNNTGINTSGVLPKNPLTDGLGNSAGVSGVAAGIATAVNGSIPNPASVTDMLAANVPGAFPLTPDKAAASIAADGTAGLNQLTNAVGNGANQLGLLASSTNIV